MITKKEVLEALALSCVENYFLAWIGHYYDTSKLYANSFVSLKQVFNEFSHGARYENYEGIPRLQDLAEEYGLVTHTYKNCSGKEALDYLKLQRGDELCLVRVNAKFFAGCKRVAWRDDHYIYVNQGLEWINQYPLSEGVFAKNRFLEVYDGVLCCYQLAEKHVSIPDRVLLQYSNQDFDINNVPQGLEALESAIGILRMSRKRLQKYYENNIFVADLLGKENKCLDKLHFYIHFQRLKGALGEEKEKIKIYSLVYQEIERLIVLEKEIARGLGYV